MLLNELIYREGRSIETLIEIPGNRVVDVSR